MSKRKELGTSSDCSEVSSLGNSSLFNSKKVKIENPDFVSCVVNETPFFDFFAKEIDDVSPSLSLPSCSNEALANSDHENSEINSTDVCLTLSLSSSGNTPTSASEAPCVSSKFPMLFGVPLVPAPCEAIPLRMYNPNTDAVEWTIKKKLTVSDCNAQHRLMLNRRLVEDRILCNLDEAARLEVSSPNGLRVNVFDCDKREEFKLTLKKWPTSLSYGLMDNWRRDFVYRRDLKAGDEVGLCWDVVNHRLLFTVLKKSSSLDC